MPIPRHFESQSANRRGAFKLKLTIEMPISRHFELQSANRGGTFKLNQLAIERLVFSPLQVKAQAIPLQGVAPSRPNQVQRIAVYCIAPRGWVHWGSAVTERRSLLSSEMKMVGPVPLVYDTLGICPPTSLTLSQTPRDQKPTRVSCSGILQQQVLCKSKRQ